MLLWYHHFFLDQATTPYSVVMTPFNAANAAGDRELGQELDLAFTCTINPAHECCAWIFAFQCRRLLRYHSRVCRPTLTPTSSGLSSSGDSNRVSSRNDHLRTTAACPPWQAAVSISSHAVMSTGAMAHWAFRPLMPHPTRVPRPASPC